MNVRPTHFIPPLLFGVIALVVGALSLNATVIGDRIIPYGSRLWQTGDDSSRNTVQAIAQTSDGFLWIGTQGGLARFDGERFEFFSIDARIDREDQRINALCADNEGSLWVGTALGLFQMRNGEWTTYPLPANVDKFILSLHGSLDGSIGIGARSGMALYQNEKFSVVEVKNFPNVSQQRSTIPHAIRAIVQNARGEGRWIGAADNLMLLKDGQAVTNLSFGAFKPDFIRTICHRRDGSIWVGSNSGLTRFRDGQYTHFVKTDGLPDNTVTALYEDRHGNLWIGTFGGLCRFLNERFVVETTPEAEPYDQIFCFFEDHEGSLWIGAKDGLHQFNALQFTSYTTRHGLAHNNVISIYEDSENTLWIGTWGGGLHAFREGKMTVYSTANTKSLQNDLILAIHGSRDGGIWFGTDYDGGLYFLKDGRFKHYSESQGLSRNAIRALLEDQTGRLFVGRATDGVALGKNGRFEQGGSSAHHLDVFIRGTNGSLYRKSYEQNAWSDWENLSGSLTSDPTAICWDSNRVDVFYRGTNDGLWHQWWDREWRGPEDLGGTLIGTPDVCSWGPGHLDVYIRGADNALWHRQYSNNVWSDWISVGGVLTSDPSAVCWGSNRVDVFYRGANNAMWHRWFADGIWSEPKDLGGVLVGAPDACSGEMGHLDVYHRGTDNACWHISFQNESWQHRYYAISGVLFSDPEIVATGTNRLDVFARGTNGLLHRSLEGQWSSTWRNLGGSPVGAPAVASYNRNALQSNYSWSDVKATRCMLQTLDGRIWIGTQTGLTCWHQGEFSIFTTQNGLPDDTVLALYEDQERNLWIGTGQGLSQFQASNQTIQAGHFKTYNFWDEAILEILEDDFQNLWLATKRGILRVAKSELRKNFSDPKHKIDFTQFGKIDGMASPVCVGVAKPSAFKSRDGRLWFATTKGLAVTDPKVQVAKNEKAPLVVIREMRVDKKIFVMPGMKKYTREDSQLLIPPGRGELQFHFTALSYITPEKNRFKYKLEGLDNDWIDAGTRHEAFYNSVPPGDYTFRVIACNNDGVWNSLGSSIKFTMQPHFWQTWWCKGLIILASFSIVGIVVRYVTRKRMQLKLERLEQQHAIEKERSRIARDMHDDLGIRLTEILLITDQASSPATNPEQARSLTAKTGRFVREVVDSLDAIVWAVNPRNDLLEYFVPYVCENVQTLLEATNISLSMRVPNEVPSYPLSSEVRHHLYMVIREAMNNLIKYSKATEVIFNLKIENHRLFVSIEDNGKGFCVATSLSSGNGLKNMAKRVNEIGGSFELFSEFEKGTCVRLNVPLRVNT